MIAIACISIIELQFIHVIDVSLNRAFFLKLYVWTPSLPSMHFCMLRCNEISQERRCAMRGL